MKSTGITVSDTHLEDALPVGSHHSSENQHPKNWFLHSLIKTIIPFKDTKGYQRIF
jgi:hypothetical protein